MDRHDPRLSTVEGRSVAGCTADDEYTSQDVVGLPVTGDTA
jgi:hypothetical protein